MALAFANKPKSVLTKESPPLDTPVTLTVKLAPTAPK
jgi:hypothetical protein